MEQVRKEAFHFNSKKNGINNSTDISPSSLFLLVFILKIINRK